MRSHYQYKWEPLVLAAAWARGVGYVVAGGVMWWLGKRGGYVRCWG